MKSLLVCLGLLAGLVGCRLETAPATSGPDVTACCPGSACCPGAASCGHKDVPPAATKATNPRRPPVAAKPEVEPARKERRDMISMTIQWQRLTGETGETCERCGVTETAVKDATARLTKVLAPYDMKVRLFALALDAETFRTAPEESNRIWIGGESVEDLLEAQVDMNACGSCGDLCGDDVVCRTLTVGGETYEAIPADLIVQAGLIAASRLITDERPGLGLTYCVE